MNAKAVILDNNLPHNELKCNNDDKIWRTRTSLNVVLE